MRVERYESLHAYTTLVDANSQARHSEYGEHGYGSGYSWDAGVNYREAIRRSLEGDPSVVGDYSALVDHLVNEYQIRSEPRNRYQLNVAGSRVSVPDYLAGSPFNMKRRVKEEVQSRSVSIYVATTCSAAVGADKMIKRGATILALLEFLQTSQVGVQLYLLAETQGYTDGDLIQVIRIESQPLDLSTAGFAIAHPSFARHITYAMAYALDGFNGKWGRSAHQDGYQAKLAAAVGMGDKDIYIPPPVSWDNEIIDHPETWLQKRIQTIQGEDRIE